MLVVEGVFEGGLNFKVIFFVDVFFWFLKFENIEFNDLFWFIDCFLGFSSFDIEWRD